MHPSNHPAASTARTADRVAHELLCRIRDGELKDGTAFPSERELCERFGTSRPTVREALTRLQLSGYATAEAGKRPRVMRPSLESVLINTGESILDILGNREGVAHLEQMRQFIETGAVREAIKRATPVQIAQIRQSLDDNEAAIGSPRFGATDIEFHRRIVAVINNPVLLTLHDLFVSQLVSQRQREVDPTAQDRRVHEEHCKVYHAIAAGDQITATQAMEHHLERSYRERLTAPEKPEN